MSIGGLGWCWCWLGTGASRSDDLHAEIGKSVDMAVDHVTAYDGADILGRSGKYDVAGKEFKRLGQLADLLRDRPDHLVQVGVLLDDTVDLEPDRPLGEGAGLRRQMQRAHGRGLVEALADLPRLSFVLHAVLQIAPRHV